MASPPTSTISGSSPSSPTSSPVPSPTPIRENFTNQTSALLLQQEGNNSEESPLSTPPLASSQSSRSAPSPRSRLSNFLQILDGSIEESLKVIDNTHLAPIFENTLRQEFEGLSELTAELRTSLKNDLEKATQRVLNQFQFKTKLELLDAKINDSKRRNLTFPSRIEDLISNPVLTDIAVQYETYSKASIKLEKQLEQSENDYRNEKIQNQLKYKEIETLSKLLEEKKAKIEELLSPINSLDISIINENLAL